LRNFLKHLVFYLNVLAAFALLLSYASTFISPAKIWVLAFFGLAYPYILLVNAVFMLFWIIRLKKAFLISFLVIVAGINHLNAFLPMRLWKDTLIDTRPAGPAQIKILSFNVRLFNIYEWIDKPGTNKAIVKFIKSERPDIICLQEFYTGPRDDYRPERMKKFFEWTPYSYIHYACKNRNGTGYGIATYSRYPIIGQGTISFAKTTNETIYTDLLVNRDTIRIYNNHLQSVQLQRKNYDFLDTLRLRYNDEDVKEIMDISSRLKNAYIKRSSQVEAISEHISSSPYPVIVCGDFNDTPVSYSYRMMRKGLKDAFLSSGKGTGSTYKGIFPYFRIDYIFHDPNFTPLIFEKVEADLSDHYPILCIFELRK
jgi:endonuclease/exonuclease/phosphatase (EEP) superfamily protein YafD